MPPACAGVSSPVPGTTTAGKFLATRRKKKATPPCAGHRQDGIIVRRLPCPRQRGQASGTHEPASGCLPLQACTALERQLARATERMREQYDAMERSPCNGSYRAVLGSRANEPITRVTQD